jgi:hypothetical protein
LYTNATTEPIAGGGSLFMFSDCWMTSIYVSGWPFSSTQGHSCLSKFLTGIENSLELYLSVVSSGQSNQTSFERHSQKGTSYDQLKLKGDGSSISLQLPTISRVTGNFDLADKPGEVFSVALMSYDTNGVKWKLRLTNFNSGIIIEASVVVPYFKTIQYDFSSGLDKRTPIIPTPPPGGFIFTSSNGFRSQPRSGDILRVHRRVFIDFWSPHSLFPLEEAKSPKGVSTLYMNVCTVFIAKFAQASESCHAGQV